MDLSVVIVNWNGGEDILRCLQSLRSAPSAVEMEVIVVDNASTDDSVEQIPHLFPSVRVIQTGTNLGFARAANRGLGAAQGDYVLFLNPDTIVPTGTLDAALAALQCRPTIGILGVRLLNSDGSVQPSCGHFLSLSRLIRQNCSVIRLDKRHRKSGWQHNLYNGTQTEEVDWAIGAFLLCPQVVLNEVGGFDEDYFLYSEDMDLCYRMRQHGYGVLYCPEVAVTHHGNRSGAQRWAEQREGEIVRAEQIFLHKHHGRLAMWGFRLLAGSLFLYKSSYHWLWARQGDEPHTTAARRYWHMTKVCFGWNRHEG